MAKTHGRSHTAPYYAWQDMKKRCNNKSRKSYTNYGAKGISYNKKWENFEGFWADMGATYQTGLTLERRDPKRNYCKSNCCWTTKTEQARNKGKYRNNSLGIANTSLWRRDGKIFLRVRIQNPATGKRVTKLFSLNKYKLNTAKNLAKEWLKLKKKELGYKETHAK